MVDPTTRDTAQPAARLLAVGVLVVLVSAGATGALAVANLADPRPGAGPALHSPVFDSARWLIVVALAACGGALLTGRARLVGPAAAAGAVLAAQLVGTGVVAVRHARPLAGFGEISFHAVGEVRLLGGALALAALVAGVACLTVLVRPLRTSPAPRSPGARVLALGVGAGVAVGLPLLLGAGDHTTTDRGSLGAYALLYSLPLGTALAATPWLPRATALTVAAIVACSGLLLLLADPMMSVTNPVIGAATVVGAALVCAGRLFARPVPVSTG